MTREELWDTELKNNMGIRIAISFAIKDTLPKHFTVDKEKLWDICKIIFLMLDDHIVRSGNMHGWSTNFIHTHLCIFIKEKESSIVRKILNESS